MKNRFFLPALLLLLLPVVAHANMLDIINNLGSSAGLQVSFTGSGYAEGFPGIAGFLREQVLVLLDVVGILLLVYAGLKLIISDEEDKLNKAKRTIAATLVGIMLAHLSIRVVEIFYGSDGTGGILTPEASVGMLNEEIMGVVDWVLTLVAVLGILMIVVSGMRAIGSFGKEEGIKNLKQTVIGTVTGIFFIIISSAVRATLGLPTDPLAVAVPGDPSPTPIIARGVTIVSAILEYLALIAVAVVIYAGFLMVINFGNEEQFTKGKTLIYRALIGLVIILVSGTIVRFVAGLFLS